MPLAVKKNNILFAIFLFSKMLLPAQTQTKTDSLKQQLVKNHDKDNSAIYNRLAHAYIFNQPDSGIYYAGKALQISDQYHNQKEKITALISLGEGAQYKANYDKSTELLLQALSLSLEEKTHSKTASIYNSIGINYYCLKDYQKAKNYILKAAKIKKELGRDREYAMSLSNIIGLYQLLQKYDSAVYYSKIAEKELIKAKDFITLGNMYNAVGTIHQMGTKNIDSAEYYYKKSVAMFNTPETEQYSAGTLNNLGQIETKRKNFSAAKNYLHQALTLAAKYKRADFRLAVLTSYSELYEASGDFKQAYEYTILSNNLKDSVLADEKQHNIAELEAKFQSAQKDKKIREQELDLKNRDLANEKEKSKYYLFIVVAIIIIVGLSVFAYTAWLKKQTKEIIEKEKSRFFSNVVHEFRTPLTLIKGPLEQLKQTAISDQEKNNLTYIERNSERLLALVNQLLDVSKIEAGKFIITKKVGNLSLFIESLIDNFKLITKDKGIHFSIDISPTQNTTLFAPDAIEKIISNLLSNAIKYTPPGGTISIKTEVNDNNRLLITITDTGAGIPAKDLPHVFNRFYQSSNHNQTGGTGIGLSLTKELVDLLNGQISLSSQVGKGTSINLSIPFENAASTDETEFDEAANNHIILLVEDDKDISDFIASALKAESITVYKAQNGKEGLSLAERIIPDIIITDIMMPEMNGIELTQLLRSNAVTAHIPLIGLSAKASQESKMEALDAGINTYLTKPFHPNELLALVHNLIQTLKNNQSVFKEQLQEEEKSYKERVKGKDVYIGKMVDVLEKHMDNSEFSVNELADALCISRSQLHRKIKSLTGLSTTHFIRTVKLEKAKDLLKTNSGNVTEIAYMCGFSSQSYFTKSFTDHFGFPPSELTKKST